MPVLVTCKFDGYPIKNESATLWTTFPKCNYKSIGAFDCHDNQGFDPVCTKTVCSLRPPPPPPFHDTVHIQFDNDWPTGFWDILFENVNDGRTGAGGCLYYFRKELHGWTFAPSLFLLNFPLKTFIVATVAFFLIVAARGLIMSSEFCWRNLEQWHLKFLPFELYRYTFSLLLFFFNTNYYKQ